jgi:hypothetical protein
VLERGRVRILLLADVKGQVCSVVLCCCGHHRPPSWCLPLSSMLIVPWCGSP